MKKPNRIGLRLFDEELQTLINASAKIFPISQEEFDNDLNPNNYEFGKLDKIIYHWHGGKWNYLIADDIDISWDDVKYKPTSYIPSEHNHSELHTHSNKSILDTITEMLINSWNSAVDHVEDLIRHITSDERDKWNTVENKSDKTYVDEKLDLKSDSIHNHDTVYSKLVHGHDYSPSSHDHDSIYSKLGHTHDYSPSNHNHDGRYYTEDEIDTKLSSKSDTGHTHDYSPSDHNHDSVYSKLTHDHDGAYYKKSEVDTRLSSKSNISHGHSELHNHSNKSLLDKLIETSPSDEYDLSNLDYIEDIKNGYTEGHVHSNLDVLDGITDIKVNEWDGAVEHISDTVKHVSTDDRDLWNTVGDKSNVGHTHNDLYSLLSHHHDNVYAPESHSHDDRYYTDTEITILLSNVMNEVDKKSDISHTHTDKADKTYVDSELAKKVSTTTFSGHIENLTIHVTQEKKNEWDNKADEAYVDDAIDGLDIPSGITVGTVKPTDGSMWYKVIE